MTDIDILSRLRDLIVSHARNDVQSGLAIHRLIGEIQPVCSMTAQCLRDSMMKFDRAMFDEGGSALVDKARQQLLAVIGDAERRLTGRLA